MHARYVAYGLQLHSSFALPGMTPALARELPVLALHRAGTADVQARWSGAGAQPVWQGWLGDGCRMRIERGIDGDVLFSYGEQASFRLDATHELLECAPVRPGIGWQRALISKVLCNVSVMRGYEGLHAAAVEAPDGVVAFAGPSGAGKSTLALELVRRGWPLFADDMVALRRAPARVRAYPATPHMSLAEAAHGASELDALGTTVARLAGERWLAARQASRRPSGIRAVLLLDRAPGNPLVAHKSPANPLLLAPYMLGFEGDGERQARRFHLYADLIGSAPLIELSSGDDDSPSDLADVVEELLAHRPALARSAA